MYSFIDIITKNIYITVGTHLFLVKLLLKHGILTLYTYSHEQV